jgi:hypothetical protein
MAEKAPKRPRDPNQLAKSIVDIASGASQPSGESAMSVSQQFARAGGLKGGKARAEKLSAEQRSKIAADAARTRWGKRDPDGGAD